MKRPPNPSATSVQPRRLQPQTRQQLQPILRVVGRVRARIWRQVLVTRLAKWLAIIAVPTSLTVLAMRLGWVEQGWDDRAQWTLAAGLATALFHAIWHFRPWLETAIAVDSRAGSGDQLSTALWLGAQDRCDAWAALQAQQAVELAKRLDIRPLFPWVMPPALRWAWLPALALAIALLLPIETLLGAVRLKDPLDAWGVALQLPNTPKGFASARDLLDENALDILQMDKALLQDITAQVQDPSTKVWLNKVAHVLQGMADGTLDKTQALEQLAQLEAQKPQVKELSDLLDPQEPPKAGDADGQPSDPAVAEQQKDLALRNAVAEAAKKAAETAPEGAEKEAMKKAATEKDLGALGKIAEKLAEKDLSDKDLEKWVKALEKFADGLKDQKIPEKFKALADRIQKLQEKRANEGGLAKNDQERLQQARHELAQLKQNQGDAQAAQHEVERLERGARQAADELRRQQQQESQGRVGKNGQQGGEKNGEKSGTGKGGQGAKEQFKQAMRAAANELKREQNNQEARQASRIAQERMKQAREALERGSEQDQARKSFDRKAKSSGDQGEEGEQGESGQQQRKQKGKSKQDQEDQATRDALREANSQRARKAGRGQEQSEQESEDSELAQGSKKTGHQLGKGKLDDPGRMSQMRDEAANGSGGQKGDGSDGKSDGNGNGQGHEKGDDRKGDSKGVAGGKREKLTGQAGDGPDVKKVMNDTAKKGFARAGWRQIYVDYSGVAEEMLDKENLPPSRRAAVRRYFEQIRPR